MILKNGIFINGLQIIDKLFNISGLSIEQRIELRKFYNELQEKLKIYNEIKNDLIKKYATNEEKNEIKLPKVKEEDYTEKDKLDVESFNNFNKEFTDYLNKEEEYKFLGIKLPDSFLINLTIKEEEYLRNEKILL